jgi:hypothetical protein
MYHIGTVVADEHDLQIQKGQARIISLGKNHSRAKNVNRRALHDLHCCILYQQMHIQLCEQEEIEVKL